ncbi:hypothetical protein [Myroides pelagicus]|uniref:Uncharacterized protein n=1 Tax=Myroides pelagicus TaxID=270914 RepID=A0A7K1GIT9_9FLAO|nr:hypothetical protein [Myroides pelagicus]MEC4115174.1 hypothetical protein [Myroides pelagicus]MTH28449.1 hypothetical protein [Myroides pelagicus]
MGIGEKHGTAAYRWTFDNIDQSYNVRHNNQSRPVQSFSNPKPCEMMGPRLFYTFNFSDQHTLNATLKNTKVMTRMAFDSRFLTRLIAFSRQIGLTKLLKNKKI